MPDSEFLQPLPQVPAEPKQVRVRSSLPLFYWYQVLALLFHSVSIYAEVLPDWMLGAPQVLAAFKAVQVFGKLLLNRGRVAPKDSEPSFNFWILTTVCSLLYLRLLHELSESINQLTAIVWIFGIMLGFDDPPGPSASEVRRAAHQAAQKIGTLSTLGYTGASIVGMTVLSVGLTYYFTNFLKDYLFESAPQPVLDKPAPVSDQPHLPGSEPTS